MTPWPDKGGKYKIAEEEEGNSGGFGGEDSFKDVLSQVKDEEGESVPSRRAKNLKLRCVISREKNRKTRLEGQRKNHEEINCGNGSREANGVGGIVAAKYQVRKKNQRN